MREKWMGGSNGLKEYVKSFPRCLVHGFRNLIPLTRNATCGLSCCQLARAVGTLVFLCLSQRKATGAEVAFGWPSIVSAFLWSGLVTYSLRVK